MDHPSCNCTPPPVPGPEPGWTQPEGADILVRPAPGPTAEELNAFVGALLDQPLVAAELNGVRYRVLGVQALEREEKTEDDETGMTARYSVLIFDYTNNRSLEATATYPDAADVRIASSARQPLPSAEEWEEAVEIVSREEAFGQYLLCGRLVAYRPMPPLLERAGPTGVVERTLTVGLLPAAGSNLPHQIVAVNMITQRVETFENGRPPGSLAGAGTCGIAPAYCPAPTRGTPGQLWIAWPPANPVWRLLAVRPAASSGVSGSGLEIRYADYRGKRVLYRGHVPVLNVQYEGNACGPYRDWQNEEHCIQVDGSDVAPGFRWTSSAPRTACSGNDAGNFTGVAIQSTECELILTTEMEAGWYRYIQEWRFHRDGTIRPRFKFAAVSNSCVCNAHIHHVYWRLDFDLRTPGNNLVEEYNDPPLVAGTNWHRKVNEIKRLRDYGRHRKWRVTNTASGERYEIIPGPTDGVADAYGQGDLWVLRYHGSEIDDGGPVGGTEAHMDRYVNGEVVENADVVVWYGAHFRHDVREQGTAECHSVGPTLKLVQW
jgi:hypothetical protein